MQCQEAGVNTYPFSFSETGAFHYDPSMTAQQIAQVEAVYQAHNPLEGGLLAYANVVQWEHASGGYTATIDGTPRTFQTDTADLPLINSTAHRLGEPSPPDMVHWQFDPITVVTIKADDFSTAATQIHDFMEQTFAQLNNVIAGVQSGTITSEAQIDAAFESIPNSGFIS